MAIATSTAILIGAGVAAAGTAASAKMQSSANNKATAAQGRATDSALTYQREKDAYERSLEDRKWQDYQQRHAAWEARRPGGAGGGGAQIGPGMGTGPGLTPQPKLAPGQLTPLGGPQATSLADLMGGPTQDVSSMQPMQAQPQQQGLSLADLAQWSKHDNYLGA